MSAQGDPTSVDAASKGSARADEAVGEPVVALSRAKRWRSIVGSVLGVGLVALAIAVVAMRPGDLSRAWEALRRAPWWIVVLAIMLPLANWVVVSLALWVITRRHGPVRAGEMLGLVAGAWLLNYLPMRPGMFGRIAYHRRVNGIPVKTSMGLLVISMGLTASAIALLTVLGLVLRVTPGLAGQIGVIAGTGMAIGALAVVMRVVGGPWHLATALLLRYADMLVWVARYWVVFRLIGQGLSFEQACAIAAVSQAATAVPLSGNGLGLREWAIGLSVAALPAWFGEVGGGGASQGGSAMTIGVAADLVNRGIEMLVALPVGLLGLAWIARRLRRFGRRGPEVPEPASGASEPRPDATV